MEPDFTLTILHEISDHEDCNVDVMVTLSGGERYAGTFFTLSNVERLLSEYRMTGECLSGTYLWASNMILVESLTFEIVEDSVRDLVLSGEIESAMARLQEED